MAIKGKDSKSNMLVGEILKVFKYFRRSHVRIVHITFVLTWAKYFSAFLFQTRMSPSPEPSLAFPIEFRKLFSSVPPMELAKKKTWNEMRINDRFTQFAFKSKQDIPFDTNRLMILNMSEVDCLTSQPRPSSHRASWPDQSASSAPRSPPSRDAGPAGIGNGSRGS